MKRSIDFYTSVLGFFYDRGISEMAWLTRGELLLTLAPGEPQPQAQHYFGWGLSSQQELSENYARLHSRYLRLSGPPDPENGRLFFFLYDPDDYAICFSCQALDYPAEQC